MKVLGIDTAISNTGIAVIDTQSAAVFLYKPISKKDTTDRPHQWYKLDLILDTLVLVLRTHPCKIVGFEDYLVGGNQRATTAVTAELVGAIRRLCVDWNIDYCRVHPAKTLKYVRKSRDVSKTEIRDYARNNLGLTKEALKTSGIDRSDESDVADALVIANIAKLAYQISHGTHPCLESRWDEILNGEDTGILVKPGLYWRSRNE